VVPRKQLDAVLIASVLGRDLHLVNAAVHAFATKFGSLAFASPPLPFTWTDYYGDELGPEPARRLVALHPPLEDRTRLATIKRSCGRLEVSLGRAGEPTARQVNIDPGYLTPGQVVLASTKASPHRIELDLGIHAELTLIWQDGAYQPLPWTYPDYAGEQLQGILSALRRRCLAQARAAAKSGGEG